MEYLPDRLEKLINSFDYDELSSEDASYVREQISPDEYISYRRLVKEGKSVLHNEKELPDTSGVRTGLMNAIDRQDKKRAAAFSLSGLFGYRIPVYQPALAATVLFVFAFLFWDTAGPEAKVVFKTKEIRDTVVVEKKVPVYQIKEVEKVVYKYVNRKKNNPTFSYDKPGDEGQLFTTAILSEGKVKDSPDFAEIMNISNKGRTLRDDSSMKKYLYTIN